jgi:hypothetical protein
LCPGDLLHHRRGGVRVLPGAEAAPSSAQTDHSRCLAGCGAGVQVLKHARVLPSQMELFHGTGERRRPKNPALRRRAARVISRRSLGHSINAHALSCAIGQTRDRAPRQCQKLEPCHRLTRQQRSVATPQRGWAHPRCRHFKIRSCLGSAFEVALSTRWTSGVVKGWIAHA